MIIQNVAITSPSQTLVLDANSKVDFVLFDVNQGAKVTSVSTTNRHNVQGQERQYWTRPLRNITITGYVFGKNLVESKIRLNRFVKPSERVQVSFDNKEPFEMMTLQSVLYGKTQAENNDKFCQFTIQGITEQVE